MKLQPAPTHEYDMRTVGKQPFSLREVVRALLESPQVLIAGFQLAPKLIDEILVFYFTGKVHEIEAEKGGGSTENMVTTDGKMTMPCEHRGEELEAVRESFF